MAEIKLTAVPAGLQLDRLGLCEVRTADAPHIRIEKGQVHYPAFIRETEEGQYAFYDVVFPKTRECDWENYTATGYAYYRELRKHFYGDALVQAEMTSDQLCQGHIAAVKSAFPKYEGEIPEMITRFETIKSEFWAAVDAVLEELGLTRSDLPPMPFNAETMVEWGMEHGITPDQMTQCSATFSAVSLNLLHNGRNWNELFQEPV